MQPLVKKDLELVNGILDRLASKAGPLIEILHEVQSALGCIPAGAVAPIAERLNLSRAEVHGVVTFYHDFRDHRPGRHLLAVCRAEACQSMNSAALIDHLKKKLGVDFHGTTRDGRLTLLPVYCLGNCACAPALMLDGQLHGRVTPQRADELLGDLP